MKQSKVQTPDKPETLNYVVSSSRARTNIFHYIKYLEERQQTFDSIPPLPTLDLVSDIVKMLLCIFVMVTVVVCTVPSNESTPGIVTSKCSIESKCLGQC